MCVCVCDSECFSLFVCVCFDLSCFKPKVVTSVVKHF